MNATAAPNISSSSAALAITMTRGLEKRSATCPAIAENSTNGAMIRAPARAVRPVPPLPSLNRASTTSAFLTMLSLNAPQACVRHNGPSLRVLSNPKAEMAMVVSPVYLSITVLQRRGLKVIVEERIHERVGRVRSDQLEPSRQRQNRDSVYPRPQNLRVALRLPA